MLNVHLCWSLFSPSLLVLQGIIKNVCLFTLSFMLHTNVVIWNSPVNYLRYCSHSGTMWQCVIMCKYFVIWYSHEVKITISTCRRVFYRWSPSMTLLLWVKYNVKALTPFCGHVLIFWWTNSVNNED